MHRILLEIGPLKVYAWGTFVGIGFLVGLYITTLLSEKFGIKKNDVVAISNINPTVIDISAFL